MCHRRAQEGAENTAREQKKDASEQEWDAEHMNDKRSARRKKEKEEIEPLRRELGQMLDGGEKYHQKSRASNAKSR